MKSWHETRKFTASQRATNPRFFFSPFCLRAAHFSFHVQRRQTVKDFPRVAKSFGTEQVSRINECFNLDTGKIYKHKHHGTQCKVFVSFLFHSPFLLTYITNKLNSSRPLGNSFFAIIVTIQ